MIMEALDLFTSAKSFRHQTTPKSTIYIDCDGERSFSSLGGTIRGGKVKSEYPGFMTLPKIYEAKYANIIITSKPDPYHNRLSIVNRVVRTMRDFAHKYFDAQENIPPEMITKIIQYYNNFPHKTLSRLIGFNVSPKMVLNDIELEGFIARKLMYLNLEQEKKKLKIGDKVVVIHQKNPKNPFEKIRYTMEPGFFTIKGFKNNLYIVENIPDERNFFYTKIGCSWIFLNAGLSESHPIISN
jgi:hypothetical protein